MKTIIYLAAIFGCTFAYPPSIDWSKVKPYHACLDPISDKQYPTARIIGGTEVVPHSRPFQVGLLIDGHNLCGGSLISSDWVVTAAHCTIRASFAVILLGAHNVQIVEPTQVVTTSSNIINHPDYVALQLTNDVSLIRLPTPVTLTNEIQPIALAPATTGTLTGYNAILSGWGRQLDSSNSASPTLRKVTLRVISNSQCTRTYGPLVIRSSNICTSGVGNIGGCSGDSGGPLTFNNILVGIASFVSSTGCQAGLPTGYTRVSSFRNWISQNSGV